MQAAKKINLAEILTAEELELYQMFVVARQLTGDPPLECSIHVADDKFIDSSVVQDIVDRVREAKGLPPYEW